MRFLQSGFSLTQLLIVMAILGMLASISYPIYQSHVQNTRLRSVQSALLENAQFMERFYQQNGTFKSSSTAWPPLPITTTDTFCIRPNNNPKGFPDEHFTLKAVAFDKESEPRVLKIDESMTAFLCSSSLSSCDDTAAFFKGTEDKDCEVFQP